MRTAIWILVICILACGTAIAETPNAESTACDHEGSYSQVGLSDVFECQGGTWQKLAPIGTELITMSIEVWNGQKLAHTTRVTTLDGQPTHFGATKDVTFISKAEESEGAVVRTTDTLRVGFHVQLLPRLSNGDVLSVVMRGAQEDLISMRKVGTGDLTIEVPDVRVFSFDQKVRITDGESITVTSGDGLVRLVLSASTSAHSTEAPGA